MKNLAVKNSALWSPIVVIAIGQLSGCGLYVPSKSVLLDDTVNPPNASAQITYENRVIESINCELSKALDAAKVLDLPWLVSDMWGTAITLTITAEDQAGVSLGGAVTEPFHNYFNPYPAARGGNVTIQQSLAFGVGGTAAANATRTETIQYTYRNSDLVAFNKRLPETCDEYQKEFGIESDLKIGSFIYDKAKIARLNNVNLVTTLPAGYEKLYQIPVFNTLTEEINFVGAFGGSLGPNWKLARLSVNPTGNMLAAERTTTNDLVITIGPLKENTIPLELNAASQAQHNARVGANAIATSIQGQSH